MTFGIVQSMRMLARLAVLAAVPAACLVTSLAGCNTGTKPTPENFLAAINKYLPDRKDCLLDGTVRFPYETGNAAMEKKMDSLVAARLLESTHEPAIHISRYTLTPAGSSAGSNLCFGYRQATDIVSSTPPALANGFQETHVVYKYRLRDEAIWAKSPDVMSAFPKLAQEASREATDSIILANNGSYWAVAE